MKVNYYKILGVLPSADASEIKRAFRQRAKESHPDLNPAPGAAEQFMKVNEAYEILSDPNKRSTYDHSLRAGVPNPTEARAQMREEQYRQWVRQAQQRAQEYAKMNYEQFQKSRFEQAEAQVFVYLQFLVIGVIWMLASLILIAPFAALYYIDWKGVLLAVLLVPISFRIYRLGWNGWKELKSYL